MAFCDQQGLLTNFPAHSPSLSGTYSDYRFALLRPPPFARTTSTTPSSFARSSQSSAVLPCPLQQAYLGRLAVWWSRRPGCAVTLKCCTSQHNNRKFFPPALVQCCPLSYHQSNITSHSQAVSRRSPQSPSPDTDLFTFRSQS